MNNEQLEWVKADCLEVFNKIQDKDPNLTFDGFFDWVLFQMSMEYISGGFDMLKTFDPENKS